jgi:hypothetical protein
VSSGRIENTGPPLTPLIATPSIRYESSCSIKRGNGASEEAEVGPSDPRIAHPGDLDSDSEEVVGIDHGK